MVEKKKFEPKDNAGVLFINSRKREGDEGAKDPNARGNAMIGGIEYWVDAWTQVIKSGKNAGQKMQTLRFRRKDAGAGDEHRGKQPAGAAPAAARETDSPHTDAGPRKTGHVY